ncbi:TPA: hypothetical protein ACGU7N_004293 [Vibrio vulnificus]
MITQIDENNFTIDGEGEGKPTLMIPENLLELSNSSEINSDVATIEYLKNKIIPI